MNNLLLYCGLIDTRIRASDKDLPVNYSLWLTIKKGKVPPPSCSNPNQKHNSAPPAPPVQHCSKGPESDTDELSEEEDDGSDDTCSETSKVKSVTF